MVIERKKLMDIILLDQKNNILKIRLNGDFEMENNIDSEEYIRFITNLIKTEINSLFVYLLIKSNWIIKKLNNSI